MKNCTGRTWRIYRLMITMKGAWEESNGDLSRQTFRPGQEMAYK